MTWDTGISWRWDAFLRGWATALAALAVAPAFADRGPEQHAAEQGRVVSGRVGAEGRAVNLEEAGRPDRRVWRPRPAAAGAPWEAAQVRIVDFGNDFLRGGDGQPRHHFHCHRYVLVQDEASGLWAPGDDPVALDSSVDVDGDGRRDDVVACHEFRLDRPFSPVAPWYDTLAGTPRWYGGQAIYQAHATTSGFSEDGVNQDHDGQFAWPRENWAVFHETYETYGPYRLAANWLWLKHDFLNGGARHRVSFDDRSRLAVVLKRYYMGIDSVRFLVRDGQQCYLSEATFANCQTHALCPTRTRWAKYDPRAPHDIYFNAEQAPFEPHEFQDVTGVGMYCSKDRFLPAYFGFKWYGFECDAVVQRPQRPSENLDMVAIEPAGDGTPFYISTTEVPYELWKTVFRQARSNNFVPPSQGFGFAKDGDCGSMDWAGPDGKLRTHCLQEPVTDLTLYDAAAWCNALSELESREPVYCEDPAFRRPLHEVCVSPALAQPHPLPKLYVNWAADGYRLPTLSEWQQAWMGQSLEADAAVVARNSRGQTQPVGSLRANAAGLYDMLGNVWEPVWTFGDCYDPQQGPPLTVLGGDFLSPAEPGKRSASPYGDTPYEGAGNIGLRIVRRAPGGPAPQPAQLAVDLPAWTIAKDSTAQAGPVPDRPAVTLDLVAVPGAPIEMARRETTFAIWQPVRDWGAAHGYRTDYDGDMGSLDYWGFDPVRQAAESAQTHGPDEPVTDITVYDMAVWCNALSDLLGRRPVYYADADFAHVYRTAVKYRPIQFHFPEDYVDKYGQPEAANTKAVPMGAGASLAPPGVFADDAASRVLPSLYRDPAADGFRLPTIEEYQLAVFTGQDKYPWGNDAGGVFDHAWLFDSAAGTTHAVGQKQPTALGLYDVLGNVSELSNPPTAGEKRPARLGGSFLDLTLGVRRGLLASDAPPPTWPYCDTGFRIVRQVAKQNAAANDDSREKTHLVAARRDGEAASNGTPGQVNVDPTRFDSLQGRVHRGNLYRDGRFQATGVPTDPKVRWQFATGGPVKSSPVAVDGLVYVGSHDGHVYAIDAVSGSEVWRHRTDARVSGSAAVVDGVVYIASEDGCLYALAAKDGKPLWKAACGQAMAGSPAVAYGAVFIGAGNRGGHDRLSMTAGPVIALNARDGAEIWRSEPGPQGAAAIASDGRRLAVGLNGSSFGGLDMRDGHGLFNVRAGHQARQAASLTFAGDQIFVPAAMRGSVLCIGAQDRPRWQTATLPQNDDLELNNGGIPGYEILGDLAVTDDLVLAGCNDGKLYAFSAAQGQRIWALATNGPVQSSPAVAGSTVYFGSWDGHLYAVNLSDGELRWKLKLGEIAQTPAEQYTFGAGERCGRIVSAPWPGDGVIYVGCDDGQVYAIE